MSDTNVMSLVNLGLRGFVPLSTVIGMRLWLVFLGPRSMALQAPTVIARLSLVVMYGVYIFIRLSTYTYLTLGIFFSINRGLDAHINYLPKIINVLHLSKLIYNQIRELISQKGTMSAQLATNRRGKKVINSSSAVLSTALKAKKRSDVNASIVVTPASKRTRKPSQKVLESAGITQVSRQPGVVVRHRTHHTYIVPAQ
jgi:hypothetical protein